MIIAVDPGRSGGIAVAHQWAEPYAIGMPETEHDLWDFFASAREGCALDRHEAVVLMEEVGGYVGGAGQPGSAMFKFGQGYGFLRACAVGNRFRLETVRPQAWQKALGLGTRGTLTKAEWKRKLRGHAQNLFPNIKVTLETADALLLLEYANKQRKGEK